MNLAHGGHLTHGMALNISAGSSMRSNAYGVRQDTGGSTTTPWSAGPRGPPEADRRGRQRLFAAVGLRADGGIAHASGAPVRRHGPHRRPGRGRCPPEPFPARRHRHEHPHKTLRGARGGLIFSRNELPTAWTPPTSRPSMARSARGSTSRSFRASRAARCSTSSRARPSRSSWALEEPFARTSAGPSPTAKVLAETLAGLGARVARAARTTT